ncbi:cell wall-binding repeat-containing protein [Bacillus swezeyi]|uniref:ArsR family transcriptional regulator n=1 Tax=Bacillus swezeyi TaxID=1925020 RepID=A0A1R1QDU6_9BACI|nr:cell wall-binding repeat-containing protein [Bacillus swezeyi]MEC1261622.1 cell wall-binding repeat-containing protein [Bacillus swezeyi]MED2926515.1 cell wall-binding repeat-containing protein [Bacillus swezeyi]MED2943984.1 cell wall-binding repeat-containing protein [Bacillus swezeyi]MED2965922.1 cell wall-binding repeat-containing protein [Bacillus swezeyi]MED2978545.1 cell wall-binding repeat-containing protein [Bacillus swezeyi]
MKKTSGFLFVMLIFASVLAACQTSGSGQGAEHDDHQMKDHSGTEKKESASLPTDLNNRAAEGLVVQNTKNTTRLDADTLEEMSIKTSQTIWPATHKQNRPGAVILVSGQSWQTALAAADLIHHPNNGPVLFTDSENISEETQKEIKRLSPLGTSDGTQILAIGNINEKALQALESYKVKQLKGKNPADLAKEIDKEYASAADEYPKSVIIGSSEDDAELYTLPAVNWIAHMPEPVLYVNKDGIPEETAEALKKRDGKANIYILGPEAAVSEKTEKALKEYGTVKRISGNNPVTNSIAFAKFKDESTDFGWGITDPGHGLSFASTAAPELALAGAPFSHLGKHAPLLLLKNGQADQNMYSFLAGIEPSFKNHPQDGPYNHGFILGTEDDISFQTQGILDDILEIKSSEGGHTGH